MVRRIPMTRCRPVDLPLECRSQKKPWQGEAEIYVPGK
jgi:hypothetical protein